MGGELLNSFLILLNFQINIHVWPWVPMYTFSQKLRPFFINMGEISIIIHAPSPIIDFLDDFVPSRRGSRKFFQEGPTLTYNCGSAKI